MNIKEKCQFLVEQAEADRYITRFGIVRVLEDQGSGYFQVKPEIPNDMEFLILHEDELFPLNDHLIVTVTRPTQTSPFDHDNGTLAVLSYVEFLSQDDAFRAAGYQVPEQTHFIIDLRNQNLTTSKLITDYEQPLYKYFTTWIDRIGTTDLAYFDDRHGSDAQIFMDKTNERLAGCSEGVWMHLLLRLEWVEEEGIQKEKSQLVDMEIYCGMVDLFDRI